MIKLLRVTLPFIVAVLTPVAFPIAAAATGTPAGTIITNTGSITYTDAAANSFTSQSNTVSTTVQSAPVATLAAAPATGVTVQGGQFAASYTLTNTGNGLGNFNLTVAAQTGADAAASTPVGYQVVFPVSATIGTVPGTCALGAAQTYLCSASAGLVSLVSGSAVPAAASIVVTIASNVSTTAASASPGADTIASQLSTTITYSAANNGGVTATTSPSVNDTETESVAGDARLDMTQSVLGAGVSGNATAFLRFTTFAANGGNLPALDLPSTHTLIGGAAGILITNKVPAFGGTPLVVQGVSATATGATVVSGANTTIYYTSSANGSSGWTAYTSGAMPGGTTFVGVLVSGGIGGAEINPNNGATSEGNVSAGNAAVVITMLVTPPTGVGSGTANAVVDEANSAIGGNAPSTTPIAGLANATQNANGPNISVGTTDATSAIDAGNRGVVYPTQAAGFAPSTALQNGTSNAVGASAAAAALVYVGPFAASEAVGSYNGVAASNNLDDFTAVSFLPAGFTPINTAASGVVGNAVGATSSTTIAGTLENLGNTADTITLSIAAPAGWGVQIYAANTAGVPTGGVLAGSTGSNTAAYAFAAVPAGLTGDTVNKVNYAVTYTLPGTVKAFAVSDILQTATSGNDGSASNTTHNDIVVGGPVATTTTQTLDAATCPSGLAAAGCIIKYDVAYANVTEAPSACPGTPPSVVPTNAGGYYGKGLTITESGTAAGNTWGAVQSNGSGNKNTTGLAALATDTLITGTTFPSGNAVGSYAFTALVGGSSTYILAPGCTGNIHFAVTVNAL